MRAMCAAVHVRGELWVLTMSAGLILCSMLYCPKQASKQASRQAGKRASKQASKHESINHQPFLSLGALSTCSDVVDNRLA